MQALGGWLNGGPARAQEQDRRGPAPKAQGRAAGHLRAILESNPARPGACNPTRRSPTPPHLPLPEELLQLAVAAHAPRGGGLGAAPPAAGGELYKGGGRRLAGALQPL